MWYDELTDDIKDRIQDTGFEDFILALPDTQGWTDYQPLHALMERWSDTTHTFHLPCGEFTLDPVSFAAITGIACAGDSVSFDTGLHRMTADRVAYIERLLGMVPDMKGTHTIKVDSIRSYYTRQRVEAATTGTEIDQVIRAFLVYLLGTTLFADTASSIDLMFLMPLRDLDLVSTFDWGSCALAYLYRSMDELVRGAKRFCGFWHSVLVFPFLSTHVSDLIFTLILTHTDILFTYSL